MKKITTLWWFRKKEKHKAAFFFSSFLKIMLFYPIYFPIKTWEFVRSRFILSILYYKTDLFFRTEIKYFLDVGKNSEYFSIYLFSEHVRYVFCAFICKKWKSEKLKIKINGNAIYFLRTKMDKVKIWPLFNGEYISCF